MIQKIKKQWFLFALVTVFLAVVLDGSDTLAQTGIFLKDIRATSYMIFIIFIVSGLLIEHEQIKSGLKDFTATSLALLVIIIIAPLVAIGFSTLPLETGAIIGFFIVSVMPTTLSSGVVMTGGAGGNMAHALFITILSNFICVFSIPLVLAFLLSLLNQERDLSIDQMAIIIKLFCLVLVPLIIGMVLKAKCFTKEFLAKFKLQLINQWLIVGVVFISLGSAKQVLLGKGNLFFYIVVLSFLYHLVLLAASFFLVKLFKVGEGRFESVVFMGSQKTLVLAVMLQVTYFSEFGTALLVCVVHHIIHLMMDGYLCTKIAQSKT